MKLLHIGDEHWSEKNLQKCIQSARQIEAIAETEKPDLIVLSGDLQDHELSFSETTAHMAGHIQRLSAIAPVAMVYGNENHDPKKSLETLKLLSFKNPVHISEYPETLYLCESGKTYSFRAERIVGEEYGIATLHFLPYPTKEYLLREQEDGQQIDNLNQLATAHLRNIFIGFRTLNIEGVPTVLIGHANLSNSKLSNGQTIHSQDIIVSADDVALSGRDYGAFGHIHLAQKVSEHDYYGGSTYHVNWGETEQKYVNVVEVIAGQAPSVRQIKLETTRPMVKLSCEYSGGVILPDQQVTEPREWEGAELRVRVRMSEENRAIFNEDRVTQFYAGAYSYKIEPETIHTDRARSENINQAVTLEQQFVEWSTAVNKTAQLDEGAVSLINEIERDYHAQGMS